MTLSPRLASDSFRLFRLFLLCLSVSHPLPGARYATVNGRPQFSSDDSHFSFYWGLWRTLDPKERIRLENAPGGFLLAQRDLSWALSDCRTGVPIHADSERFWFLDKIQFDDQGRVIPIREAVRADYLYFSIVNINSLHFRGNGPFSFPRRKPGESFRVYREKESAAYTEWEREQSPRGTRGRITVLAMHRLFDGTAGPEGRFFRLEDYRLPTSEFAALFTRFQPDRWPIFYDERAHKPHAIEEPAIWSQGHPLSEDRFSLRLDWDWCDESSPVTAVIHVPRGEIPPSGPTRPGRTDAGAREIRVIEE